MPSYTNPRTAPRRPTHGRRYLPPRSQRQNELSAAASPGAPTAADQRRWYDHQRNGIGIAELATREQVKLSTIERSLQVMRAYTATNSQEATELATRATFLRALPTVEDIFHRAATATQPQERRILNPDTQETFLVDEVVPDIKTQLSGAEMIRKFMEAVQPRQPAMAVNVNASATAQSATFNAASSGQGPISAEAIIREIRQQRGLAAPQEIVTRIVTAPVTEDVDSELAEDLEYLEEAEARERDAQQRAASAASATDENAAVADLEEAEYAEE
jgi:hypothetical protein